MVKSKKSPKLKKGAWFYKVRGSYMPASAEGWLAHTLLLFCSVAVLIIATYDERELLAVLSSAGIQLIGVGALFTWVASRHS